MTTCSISEKKTCLKNYLWFHFYSYDKNLCQFEIALPQHTRSRQDDDHFQDISQRVNVWCSEPQRGDMAVPPWYWWYGGMEQLQNWHQPDAMSGILSLQWWHGWLQLQGVGLGASSCWWGVRGVLCNTYFVSTPQNVIHVYDMMSQFLLLPLPFLSTFTHKIPISVVNILRLKFRLIIFFLFLVFLSFHKFMGKYSKVCQLAKVTQSEIQWNAWDKITLSCLAFQLIFSIPPLTGVHSAALAKILTYTIINSSGIHI